MRRIFETTFEPSHEFRPNYHKNRMKGQKKILCADFIYDIIIVIHISYMSQARLKANFDLKLIASGPKTQSMTKSPKKSSHVKND